MIRLSAFLLLLVAFPAFSQRFDGGLLAGGLVSQVDGDTWQGYHKTGFYAGGLVSLRLSEHSSFQMEMAYIQKGMKQGTDTVTNTGTSYLSRIHCLEIPLLYQFSFGKRFQAEIGPAADVVLWNYDEVNGMEVPELTVPYRRVSLAGLAGFSGYITDHLKATFRFSYSLMSTRSGPVEGQRKILFEAGQYNNVLSLGLSWYFKGRDGSR